MMVKAKVARRNVSRAMATHRDLSIPHEQHEEDGGGCANVFAVKDAGAEVAQPGDGIKQRANYQNRNVSAENQHGKFPGNFVQDGEHQKHRAQQQLVSDRVEILSKDGLLFERASQQAIEAIAHPSEHE